jgi:hypothetical protein
MAKNTPPVKTPMPMPKQGPMDQAHAGHVPCH